MSATTYTTIFSLLAFSSLTVVPACMAGSQSSDEERSEPLTGPAGSIDAPAAEPQARGDGLCCWGHCNSSGPFPLPDVTVECRANVVRYCHNHGESFDPNGDAWWGTCP